MLRSGDTPGRMSRPLSPVTFTTQGALRKSALRQANERLVLNVIRQNPECSRVEITRITGLSPSSVTFIVKRLLRENLVREERVDTSPQAGRPPIILKLTPAARYALAVDLSPTGSRLAVAEWTGAIVSETPLEWNPNPQKFLEGVRDAMRFAAAPYGEDGILGIGISVAGTCDARSKSVTTAPNLGWRDVSLAPLFDTGIDAPVFIDNNANLSALAERWFRSTASRPLDNFVFVTLSGGIGSGIIFGGQVLHGAFGRAGEFGHMTIVADGRQCLCGNRGCWEEYASDRALIRLYEQRTGTRLTAKGVVDLARSGDKAAAESLLETAHNLGLGFANLIMGLNPESIYIDTWAAAGWDLLKSPVWKVLRRSVPASWLEGVQVRASVHAEQASLLGAVALALSQYFLSFDHSAPSESPKQVRIHS